MFWKNIFEINCNINLMKIRVMGAQFFHADGEKCQS